MTCFLKAGTNGLGAKARDRQVKSERVLWTHAWLVWVFSWVFVDKRKNIKQHLPYSMQYTGRCSVLVLGSILEEVNLLIHLKVNEIKMDEMS